MKILIILLFLSMVPAAVAPGVNTSVCAETDHSAVTSTQEWDANNLKNSHHAVPKPRVRQLHCELPPDSHWLPWQTRAGPPVAIQTDKEGVCDSPTNQAVLQAGSKQCYANDSRCRVAALAGRLVLGEVGDRATAAWS